MRDTHQIPDYDPDSRLRPSQARRPTGCALVTRCAADGPATGARLPLRGRGHQRLRIRLGLPGRQARSAATTASRATIERRYLMIAAAKTVDIPALKGRYPLGDVVEASGINLRGRGRVRQGICPFHEETAGSFTVYADSQRWYCFGCGLGGDVLDFIQRLDGVDLPEAIRRLQGSTWEPVQRPSRPVSHQPPAQPFNPDPQLLTAATRFYASQLRRSPAALEYLASRGIELASARRLGLGFSTGHGLREHLRSLGFDDGRLQSSGLFSDRGERFAGMIVVPEVIAGVRVGSLVEASNPTPGSDSPPCPVRSRCSVSVNSLARCRGSSSPRDSSTG